MSDKVTELLDDVEQAQRIAPYAPVYVRQRKLAAIVKVLAEALDYYADSYWESQGGPGVGEAQEALAKVEAIAGGDDEGSESDL